MQENSGSRGECRTQKLAADGGQMLRWVVVKLQIAVDCCRIVQTAESPVRRTESDNG